MKTSLNNPYSPALFIVALIAAFVSLVGCRAKEGKTALPEAKNVKSVTVKFEHPDLDEVSFTATADDWTAIRKQLLPAKLDDRPASWEWRGTVNIVRSNDEPYRIELYSTSKDPGAFAAGKTFEERVYYRGGSSAGLLKALTMTMTTAHDLTIDPLSINRKIGRANELEIKVMKASGGFYDTVGLTDKGEIEKLGDLIDAKEALSIRGDAEISSTIAADIDLISNGTKIRSFRLRGNHVQFGSNYQFDVELKTDNFYRQLRELVNDPVED